MRKFSLLKLCQILFPLVCTQGDEESSARPRRLSAEVKKEQYALLYKSFLGGGITVFFISLILFYIHISVTSRYNLFLWFIGVNLISVLRIVSSFAYRKVSAEYHAKLRWDRISLLLAIYSAVVWGSTSLLLFPEGDRFRQAATLIVLAGVSSGAVSAYSLVRSQIYIMLSGMLVPPIIMLFIEGGNATAIGLLCLLYLVFLAFSANFVHQSHLQNITLRLISRRSEEKLRASKRSDQQIAEIFKMIAANEPAGKIFDLIALYYEARHPGMRCSMLTLEGNLLRHGGAPSLPEEYCQAVDGLKNGPDVGSCGTSTFTGQRVLVEDIETDPKWAEIKHVALPHEMRCCWSEPIFDSQGKILGAFGMYYDHPALPNEQELADLESAARIAGIVMERDARENFLKLLSNSLEQAGEAVAITDANGKIEYVNSAYSRFTGYEQGEVLGLNPCILNSGRQGKQFYKELWGTITAGNVWSGQLIEKRKDGTTYPARLVISPVRNSLGEITHYVGTHSDQTEMDLLTEQLHQKYKMEAIGHMAGGIAHNFNNNLAIILGNVELLKFRKGDPERENRYMENILTAVNRSRDLVQQLLSYSRDNNGVEKGVTSLLQVVSETIELLRATYPATVNIRLDCQPSCNKLTTFGNPTKIQEALINLCNNAVHAMEEQGELEIGITYANLRAEDIPAQFPRSPGEYACIRVKDNGHGIAENHLQKIFDPFFTTKRMNEGTGMGLATVQGIINQHDGLIKVHSVQGEGSLFELYFPLCEVVQHALKEQEPLQSYQGTERVLLVDDDVMLLETCEEMLSENGYQVEACTDSLAALVLFRKNPEKFDVIITDQTMPKLTGTQLIKEVLDLRPDMPVILCTGYSRIVDEKKALAAGAKAYCLKPLNLARLLKTTRAVLDGGDSSEKQSAG